MALLGCDYIYTISGLCSREASGGGGGDGGDGGGGMYHSSIR